MPQARPFSRQSTRLSSADLRAILDALQVISEACVTSADFAHHGVHSLPRLVGSELTTLSICDLATGHRSVVSNLPGAISKREIEVFDRYFHEHPLVRAHGRNRDAVTRRIDDRVARDAFERTPLFNEYSTMRWRCRSTSTADRW